MSFQNNPEGHMQSWVDNEGRKWSVRVNMKTCRDVKAETGWDLPNILNDGMEKLSQLVSDKFELFSVLCCLCREQMEKLGLSDEDFGEAHGGEALLRASDAFLEALADFFPERQSKQLKTLLQMGREVSEALATKADEEIGKLEVSTLTSQALSTQEFAESVRGSLR